MWGQQPQLFDLTNDPAEDDNLATKPEMADTLDNMEKALRDICDPQQIDERAKLNQAARRTAPL